MQKKDRLVYGYYDSDTDETVVILPLHSETWKRQDRLIKNIIMTINHETLHRVLWKICKKGDDEHIVRTMIGHRL